MLRELFGQTVIIKHNTYFNDRYPDSNIQTVYHNRFGQIGVVTLIIDDNYVQVEFEDGKKDVVPLIQAFFLHCERKIFNEVMSCEEYVIERQGQAEYDLIRPLLDASHMGRVKEALRIAYKSVYVNHFITFTGCPDKFPPYMYEQEENDGMWIL